MTCTCNTNDSTYILYGFFLNQNVEDLGLCVMIMQMLFENRIFLMKKCTQCEMYCVICPNATKICMVEYRL